jgi:hypothetical protein
VKLEREAAIEIDPERAASGFASRARHERGLDAQESG